MEIITERAAQYDTSLFKSCPVCGTEELFGDFDDDMIQHIIGHLTFIALKSLPPHYSDNFKTGNTIKTFENDRDSRTSVMRREYFPDPGPSIQSNYANTASTIITTETTTEYHYDSPPSANTTVVSDLEYQEQKAESPNSDERSSSFEE